jgi:hypothetical protein
MKKTYVRALAVAASVAAAVLAGGAGFGHG